MPTGCPFGEVVALEWSWIKGRRVHLPDFKSRPGRPTRHVDNITVHWQRSRNEAGLPGLRFHDLVTIAKTPGPRPRRDHRALRPPVRPLDVRGRRAGLRHDSGTIEAALAGSGDSRHAHH